MDKYAETHPDEGPEIHPERIAAWAVQQGLWKWIPIDPVEILRRQLSRSLREEYMDDPQGRVVRANHPVPGDVMTPDGLRRLSTWYPIFAIPPKKMRLSMQLRRRAALADVVQLKIDFDSYNDNNLFKETIEPLDFDFNKDIEEMNMPTEYDEPDEDPTDDSAEDED
jgi:hypothetical protein